MNIKDFDSKSEFTSSEYAEKALHIYNERHGILQDSSDWVIVDVGAGQPFHYSNTFTFRNKGSKVIAIEPIKRFCEMFTTAGFEVLNYAVCETDVGEIIFREFPARHDGLSCSGIKSKSEQLFGDEGGIDYIVPALSLTTILEKHHPEVTRIDILDLDTEGTEIEIINGLDMNKYQPKVIIIENIDRTDRWTGVYGYHELYEPMGYELLFRCAHNDILIKK